jgi:hypothetical protein
MISAFLIFVSSRAPKIQLIPVASQQRNYRPSPYFIQIFSCSSNITFQKTHIFSNTLENLTALRQSVDIKWPRNLAHVFCVYLPVLACSGPSRLITPCLDCIMGRGVGFLCWHKEGKNQWAQLIPHVLIGGVEWNCVRTWVAVRKCRTRSDWDKSYYSVPQFEFYIIFDILNYFCSTTNCLSKVVH